MRGVIPQELGPEGMGLLYGSPRTCLPILSGNIDEYQGFIS